MEHESVDCHVVVPCEYDGCVAVTTRSQSKAKHAISRPDDALLNSLVDSTNFLNKITADVDKSVSPSYINVDEISQFNGDIGQKIELP